MRQGASFDHPDQGNQALCVSKTPTGPGKGSEVAVHSSERMSKAVQLWKLITLLWRVPGSEVVQVEESQET